MAVTLGKILIFGATLLALPVAAQAQRLVPADVLVQDQSTAPAADRVYLQAQSGPVIQPLPGRTDENGNTLGAVQHWTTVDARALYIAISGIGSEGLVPEDYDLAGLGRAIEEGAGPGLDRVASRIFRWLIEDLRDGRTPMEARRQWFVVDPDRDLIPTERIMADALTNHDIIGVIDLLAPRHGDYIALRQALAETAPDDRERIALIRANMDRWRWLARDLGQQYLITNVPEYRLRLAVGDQVIRSYRTIVGKPGRTATPQLAEIVEGVILNPTWTVPQSIVVGEGLGQRVLNNPQWARARGYVATRGRNGYVSVVQQPGPANSLGEVKLDMPNAHAIFLHDTPSRELFNQDERALSHGCIRTENVTALALALTILQADLTIEEGLAALNSREYTRIEFERTIPVYITYFTMGRNVDGEIEVFEDLYGRDAPVLASMAERRIPDRSSEFREPVVAIQAPGA